MKAAIRTEYGTEEVIKIQEIAIPEPAPDQVLIKVMATTVNRTDCGVLTGLPRVFRLFVGIGKPRRQILGTDFAGIVEAIGSKVDHFKIGDRVWGLNDEGAESQAQYMVFSTEAAISHIPEGISFETAAASAEGAHYAINFLNKINIRSQDQVLINGATGAIGSAALQLLKNQGVHVTAVNHSNHSEKIRALGAARIIEYDKQDFTKEETKYDFILDTVGNKSFRQVKRILKPRGRYMSSELGPNWENLYLSLVHLVYGKKKVVFPMPTNPRASLGKMSQLLKENKFSPLVDTVFELDQIANAYAYAASGQKTGNLIIRYW